MNSLAKGRPTSITHCLPVSSVSLSTHISRSFAAHLASFTPSENSSRATSGIRVSDSGSLDTVIEARPVGDKALHASGTIIEARPVDDEGLDTVIEAQPVVEDESVVKINDTYAATQVRGSLEFNLRLFEQKTKKHTCFHCQ